MTTTNTLTVETQHPALFVGLGLTLLVLLMLSTQNITYPLLFIISLGMGVSLYHAAFGFTAAYRRLFTERDISGVTAQFLMLSIAMILFAPLLAEGRVFDHGVRGAIAPVGVSMILGAFIFGIGMQLAGGCGSGTLFTVGGGSTRMILVLIFFCIGGFQGSLDLSWWRQLPETPGIAFGQIIGWGVAIPLQLLVLALIYLALRYYGFENKQPLWFSGKIHPSRLIRGPWPLFVSAGLLAVFNSLTLLVAGHPWSITWAFALWAAKTARLMGWDSTTSSFWNSGFQQNALIQPLLYDTTSVMNIGIILGAFCAATLAGRIKPTFRLPVKSVLTALIGGLLLGYGSRLASGCNIGAFFSGIASTSLHGWVWIIAALTGNAVGLKLLSSSHNPKEV